jgi:hypothetical protein
MANPTTNYGFILPTSTDLVTDLPADFEVALQGVDTQMKTNADAATQKATLTTKGDIYAATGTSTPARVAVGTDGQVLLADSTAATGVAWAAAGGMFLLSTTALSGASTVISGIPTTYKTLKVIIYGVTNATAAGRVKVDFGGNNFITGAENGTNFTVIAAVWTGQANANQANGDSVYDFTIDLYGTTSFSTKPIHATYFYVNSAGTTNIPSFFDGIVYKTTAINSVTISNSGGNLNGGTALVYGVN